MQIGVLGPFRVTVGDRPIRLPAKQQVLLAVLALEANTTVSADRLMAALWGEDVAPSALATLQSHVFQLRRELAAQQAASPGETAVTPVTVDTDGHGYRLRISPADVDAQRFESLLTEGRSAAGSSPTRAIDLLAEAVALWRGPTGADIGEEPVATAELDRLVELRHGAFDLLTRLRVAQGRLDEAIPALRRELREFPYREPLWASLMEGLAASGRKAEALIAYREATEALRRELDAEPGDELQALAARIRNGGAGPGEPVGAPRENATAAVPPSDDDDLDPIDALPSAAPAPRARRRAVALAGIAGTLVVVVLAASRLLSTATAGAAASPPANAPASMVAADSAGRITSGGTVMTSVALNAHPDAIASGAGSLWVTSPSSDQVVRVDPNTGTVIGRIHVGHTPGGIAFGFGDAWVADSGDRTVDRIDPAVDDVVATIEVGAAPTGVATDDAWVWVTDRLDHAVTRIDPVAGTTARYAVGASPLGIAAANGSVWVVDGASSDVAQLDPATGAVRRVIPVGSGPTAIAASPSGDAVWVANTGSGTVFRIDTATATVTAAQPVGAAPSGIVVTSDAVWVAVPAGNQVVRLDPGSAQILGRIALSSSPVALASDGDGIAFAAEAPAGSHVGGTLRVASTPDDLKPAFDPTYQPFLLGGLPFLTNDGLVTYKRVAGPDGLTIVPDLAADIPEPTDGGRTWTFHLRPGISYSDGRPVRASDALGSFERAAIASATNPTGAGLFGNTEILGAAACGETPPCDLGLGITTDDATGAITFHLATADMDFPSKLFGVPLLPPGTPMTQVTAPLPATGPYELAAFTPGVSARLVRNPQFHEWSAEAQPAGNPDEIVVTATTRDDPTLEVTDGTADVLHVETEPAARLAQLRTQVPGQLHVAPSFTTWFEFMNTDRPPFDDPRVREAVNLATDRAALVDAWGGPLSATVTCQVLPPDFAAFVRYCPFTVDPGENGNWLGPDVARAKQLIAEAGVTGASVTVAGWDDGGQHRAIATYFAGLLDSLGFHASLKLMGFDAYFGAIGTDPDQFQMAGYWNRDEDRRPEVMLGDGFRCPAGGQPYGDAPAHWCDARLDGKMDQATSLGATDPVGAGQLWAQVDHDVVDAAPAVMPFNPTDVTLFSARVGGFQDHPILFLYDQLRVQ